MERRRLSSRQIIQKVLLIIVIIGLLFYGICVNSFAFIGLLFFAILGGYRVFYLPDLVEFDDDYMYVIYKEGTVEVNLKDIFYISPTGFGNLGKIKYIIEKEEYYAQFTPRFFSSSFKEFKALVVNKNPKVIIKGYNRLFPFN